MEIFAGPQEDLETTHESSRARPEQLFICEWRAIFILVGSGSEHLVHCFQKLNARLGADMTPTRAKEMRRRRVKELVEFLLVGKRKDTGETYGGRTSGEYTGIPFDKFFTGLAAFDLKRSHFARTSPAAFLFGRNRDRIHQRLT